MTLTPRQIWAYLEFSNRVTRVEQAANLTITAIAAQGDQKAIEKTLNELNQ